jgi:hypothetical protein
MKTQEALVDGIIESMKSVVEQHGLGLLKSQYANDLLIHDRDFLLKMALPGAHLAWVVGDMHTHIVPLGFEKNENEMVFCLTRLANNDKFYSLKIGNSGKVTFEHLARDKFEALAATPVAFTKSAPGHANFWLMHQGRQVGHISVESVGTIFESKMLCTVTPVEGISPLESAALRFWAGKAVTNTAGTLFIKSDLVWEKPIEKRKVA